MDGSSLRFIQDIRPANAVTVRNSGGPPVIDAFSEDFADTFRRIFEGYIWSIDAVLTFENDALADGMG
ncbi:hypothetical protein AYI69_g8833 [Smittium culicis]|uniref:Uncharacterized protein n=1 Tax=Smittium culicis TaxID=133412 RepID=A0A1R1XGU5_9FUNG|nr:hypothetical protein AYI69_g8833 [Smittium culicis]